jgi:HEAT repeat protein
MTTSLASQLAGLHASADFSAREELILSGLESDHPETRETAIAWAARHIEPQTLARLVARDDQATLRNSALSALERQGPYAIAMVERMLADEDGDVAMFGCLILGHIGTAANAEALLRLVGHANVNVAQAAVEALGRIRAQVALPVLVDLLQREPWLQLAAIDALGELQDSRAVPPLLELASDDLLAEPSMEALARIGAPEAVAPLINLLLVTDPAGLRCALLRAIAAGLERAPSPISLAPAGPSIQADGSESGIYAFLDQVLRGVESCPDNGASGTREDDRHRSRGGDGTVRSAAALVIAAELEELLPNVVRWAAGREGAAWVGALARRYPSVLRPSLPGLLTHPEPTVRRGALLSLPFTTADRAALTERLGDTSPEVRTAACQALGTLADAEAIPALVELLTGESEEERSAASAALARMDAAALESALGPLLREGSPEELVLAVLRTLDGKRCPGLANRILQLAQSRTPAIRRAALRLVSGLEGSKAEVLLLRALADREPAIQMEVLDLLLRRPGGRVVETLLALLQTGDSLRYHVIRALGRLGDARAIGPLEALCQTAPIHEKLEAMAALVRLRSPAVRPFLLESLDVSHPEVRRVAAQGLAALATESDLGLLQRLADDPDWVVRNEAGQGLGRLALPAARRTLLDLARDVEPIVAQTARSALQGGSIAPAS